MWAIAANGVGKIVAARSIQPDWDLVEGESFKVEHWAPGMVLAEDGESIRELTQAEKDAAAALESKKVSVTPWQFRKALNQLDLRAQVEQAVAASDDQDLKDGWEFATEFVRTDPLVVSVGLALGKTEQDLDDLFALARTL